jgi:multidrug transporter EmrE-like cation transporter
MKSGAGAITSPGILGIITNLPVMAGYCLYGISTILLVLALKDGELSILYPVIALTYVWVMVLSVWFFREALNVFKVAGVSSIVLGVCVLGRAGQKKR